MWKLKSMGQYLLKMDIGHRWDVLKLTFWVSSDDEQMLQRLSGESLNGGQFTCTSDFSAKCSSLRNGTIRWQCREIALQVLRALFSLFLFKGTECRGFGEREGGPGDNENKSMGRLCLMAFIFFLNINGFKPKFHKHLCMNKSANMYICATSSTL